MQKVKLNLIPQGVPPVVYASQYDIGRQFEFEIYEGDVEYEIPSDTVITVHGIKKDNHSFAYSTNDDTSKQIEFSSSLIMITTTEQMTLVPGDIHCEFVLKKNLDSEDILGTLNFVIHVEPCPIPEDAATSASDLQAYQDMVNRTAASEKAAANSASAADATYKKTSDVYNKAVKDIAERRTQINKDIDDKKSEIQTLINNFNKGSLYAEDTTLLASGWTGSDPPYSYTLPQATDTNAIFIDMAMPGLTEDQIGAISAAKLSGSKGNIIYATGEKPEIDIPVRLVYLKGDNK